MKEHICKQYRFMFELVPPGCHQCNATEVAIRNFKAHFLSVLAGTVDNFPPSLWHKLLPQTEITLDLLRQSNASPIVSAYVHLNSPFNYNKMPLAPMGCEVQVHKKADKRGSWAYHSVDGWYLNTSPEHYRTHNCYMKSTHCKRLTDTIQFQHKDITNPSLTPADKLMNAIANCRVAIKGLIHDSSNRDIQDLTRLLTQAEQQVNSPHQIPPQVQQSDPTPDTRVEDTPVPSVHITTTPPVQQANLNQQITRAA
ncbi:hypothetical protein ACHAW6_010283 [Cyclotella cf. meneghiniana]